MITTKHAALGAAAMCLILLAGCGKETMTSYEAEKSRIRDALPKSVTCNETAHGAGKMLACQANALTALLISQKGESGQDILNVVVEYNQYLSRDPVPISVMVKLLSAYDFTTSDMDTCANTRFHSKQAKTYSMSCRRNQSKGHDYTVDIKAQRAI